jgi:hypothetical protein
MIAMPRMRIVLIAVNDMKAFVSFAEFCDLQSKSETKFFEMHFILLCTTAAQRARAKIIAMEAAPRDNLGSWPNNK